MKDTDISPEVRKKVLARDSWDGCPCCILCGKPLMQGAHLHHVIERSRGGKGTEDNLVTLCFNCHSRYHNTYDPAMRAFFEDYLEEKK